METLNWIQKKVRSRSSAKIEAFLVPLVQNCEGESVVDIRPTSIQPLWVRIFVDSVLDWKVRRWTAENRGRVRASNPAVTGSNLRAGKIDTLTKLTDKGRHQNSIATIKPVCQLHSSYLTVAHSLILIQDTELNIVKLQIEDREIFGRIQTHPTKTLQASEASWRKTLKRQKCFWVQNEPKKWFRKIVFIKEIYCLSWITTNQQKNTNRH